jgi:DNA primase
LRRYKDQRAFDFRALDLVADPLFFQKVSAVYEALLEYCGNLSEESLQYLRMRGISQETAKEFRLGYVSDYAKSGNYFVDIFPEELLAWTDLFNDKSNFRFYKHRLLIPYTLDAKVVYVQGRTLDSRVEPQEIGLNRPFPCPFNIDVVKRDGVKKVYLCEGTIDTLTLIERGLPAIGIPGYRGFKREWIRYFLGKQTVIVLNNGTPGRYNASYTTDFFARAMLRFKVVALPSGEDVKSYSEVLREVEVE